jgi:hypothetical protein
MSHKPQHFNEFLMNFLKNSPSANEAEVVNVANMVKEAVTIQSREAKKPFIPNKKEEETK